MNRGIYPPLAGAVTLERRLDILSHNIGNVHTSGFKKDKPVFATILARVVGPPLAGVDLYPRIADIRAELSQGSLQHTGRSLDVALNGKGFLVVKTANGERLFRGGSLYRHPDGQLVTSLGDPLLGKKGILKLPKGEVSIDQEGNVRVNNILADRLRVEAVPEGIVPGKAGDLYWVIPNTAEPDSTTTIHGGMLEKSNVEPSTDLVEMIKVTRGYEQMQRAIRTMDELTAQVIQVARVQG